MQNKIIKKDLKNGLLEVEGSEKFVSKQLDELLKSHSRRQQPREGVR